jgi:cytochrome P450
MLSELLQMSYSSLRHKQEKVSLQEYDDDRTMSTNTFYLDIHATHVKNLETFVKTEFEDMGTDRGISAEMNPVKHRDIAKKLSPAFSPRHTKAKEATLQHYLDYFVERMKEIGGGEKGVDMRLWTDWLALDISADMTYNRQMNQMKESKSLDILSAHSLFLSVLNQFCSSMLTFEQ